ncbi:MULTISPECIES: 2'-5' RNA ligase family protein [Caldimonas]|uniref:2'-5' RNA ligase family protein n=1 Tax=Caldimonas TaxID=196013 RepID=UPI00078300A4|nr:2'-5' RNA ligase family protein [Caldimonas taiwanensis]MCX7659110.1 2'-5' RNA ligase family protein [Caldimonas manganoxidans]
MGGPSSSAKRDGDSLFFALLPPAQAQDRIQAVVDALARRGLQLRRPVPRSLWHLTLLFVGRVGRLPDDVVDRALALGAAVRMQALSVTLDRLLSFDARPGAHPLVLATEGGDGPLRQLHQALVQQGQRLGLACASAGFTPHLTLGREAVKLPPESVEPIEWQARGFVLMRSLVGLRRHVVLGRWES